MGRSSPIGSGARPARGFAYVLLLALVAAMAVAAAGSLGLGASMSRRAAEAELLAIGGEFQQALNTYAGAPAGATARPGLRGPRTLEELLRDPRVPGVHRHLRQIYADPLSGEPHWGLVRDPEGFIIGVHSRAPGRPIRRTGFEPRFAAFEEAESYAQWVFGFTAAIPARLPEQRAAPGI